LSHPTQRRGIHEEASIIGLDLAKWSFQAHGTLADGRVAFRKKLTREKVLGFFAEHRARKCNKMPSISKARGVDFALGPHISLPARGRYRPRLKADT
jgi:hypothetical protein